MLKNYSLSPIDLNSEEKGDRVRVVSIHKSFASPEAETQSR